MLRNLIIIILFLLLSAFKFVQISDVHYGVEGAARNLRAAIAKIKTLKPDFVIISGDLTNDPVYDSVLGKEEMTGYMTTIKTLGLPFYNIPGNHDLGYLGGNYAGNRATNISNYKKIIGELYYSFKHENYTFIMINNNGLYSGNSYYIDDEQKAFIESNLSDNTIIIGHYPMPSEVIYLHGHSHGMKVIIGDTFSVLCPDLKTKAQFLLYTIEDSIKIEVVNI